MVPLKMRCCLTNGAANNGTANNGTEDRTNLSPAKLAEAVQGDQDNDQPS